MKTKFLLGAVSAAALVVFGAALLERSSVPAPASVQTQTQTQTPATTQPADPGTQPAPGTTQPAATGYTMAEVATHGGASSCWAAINGNVYDLTNWINQHPGGPDRILSLCGTDGSAAFNAQHGGQGRPAQELAQFLLGPLAQQ